MWLAPAIVLAQAISSNELDVTVKGLYSVISGGKGEARDWDKFRALFAENAQMRAVVKSGEAKRVVLLTPEDYVKRAGPALERDGFYESEVARKVNVYGDLASIWSTYESRRDAKDEKPFDKGINAIVLALIDGKWKVVSITWTNEGTAGKAPDGTR